MKVLADENIPLIEEFFGDVGDLVLVSGRTMTNEMVRGADVLLVRSVTRVNSALLHDSKVAFVGSATIGVDHVDCQALKNADICFSNAPGCNANAVAEYVLSCLLWLAHSKGVDLRGLSVAVVGYGNVGKAVFRKLTALGLQCVAVDPFLKDRGVTDLNNNSLLELDEVLSCDVLCLHTPLTFDGAYPTFHQLSDTQLRQLKPNVVIINAGRGAVLDNNALATCLAEGQEMHVALDVWENEPNISSSLMKKVDLATPHIAGYSMEGKWRGTEMIYQAFCRWQGVEITKNVAQFVVDPIQVMTLQWNKLDYVNLFKISQLFYDVTRDDQSLRAVRIPPDKNGVSRISSDFDHLRKHYPFRREFHSKMLSAPALSEEDKLLLSQLGFQLKGLS